MSVEAPEKLSPHKRLLRISQESSETVPYDPSTSEKLLEEICKSFGTPLGEAFVSRGMGIHLVRLSEPVVFDNPQTRDRKLLQVQFSRFSPFNRDTNKVVDVYRKNKGKAKGDERIITKILESWGDMEAKQVTETDLDTFVRLARWRKGIYFSLFSLQESEAWIDADPFYVHESGQHGLGTYRGRRPDVHIAFLRQPKFIVHGHVEPEEEIQDQLYIEWPRWVVEHEAAVKSAFLLHSINQKNRNPITSPIWTVYDVPSTEPIERTMGFIQAYIRQLATGATL